MITKPLLITVIALTLSLVLASYGLYKQIQANGRLAVEIEAKQAQIEAGEALIAKERAESKAASDRAIESQQRANENAKELEKLHACIADKSCVPRVRVKSACPSVSGASTSAAGSNAATAGFAEINGSDYYRLIEAQKKSLWMIAGLQAEVAARSHPDFCQPK
jgi:shikimate kinase